MVRSKTIGMVAALMLMTGCAANDQNLTRAQGAGAGAALGAGLGALIGKDTDSALIGAAVGGLAGLAVGEVVARKKADYVSTEAMIEKERELAQNNASEMADYNASLRDHLDTLNQDIQALEAEVALERSRHAGALDLRARAEDNLDQARQRLAEVSQEVDVSRQLYEEAKAEAPPVDLTEWDRQIRELERRRSELVVLIGDFEASAQQIS